MNTRNTILTLGLALAGALASCTGGAPKIEGLGVQASSNDHTYGIISPNGEYLVEEEYDAMPTMTINGVYGVETSDGITLYNANDNKAIRGCKNLIYAGFFNEDIMPVCQKEKRISVINRKGEVQFTITPKNGKEITETMPYYSDGMLAVANEDDKIGFLDSNGELAIKCKYINCKAFRDGKAMVKTEGGKWQVIDKTGEVLFSLKNDEEVLNVEKGFIDAIHDGYIPVRRGEDKYGFYDMKGEFHKCPSEVSNIREYNSDVYVYYNSDFKDGVMKMETNEKVITSNKYNDIYILPDGSGYIARKDDKFSLLDKNGEVISRIRDIQSVNIIGNLIIAYDGTNYRLIDSKGENVGKEEFADYSLKPGCDESIRSQYNIVLTEAPAEDYYDYDY